MDEKDFKALADQLRQPDGERGIQVANQMEQNNANMIVQSINALAIKEGDRILEAGFGNAAHLPVLLNKANNLHYTGVDISELMLQEATKINDKYIRNNQAAFILTDGITLPFEDHLFDAFFTINTIYFWQNPLAYATEILRVLKPMANGNICFAEKSFMKQLPFTPFGFTLYDTEEVEALLNQAGAIQIKSKYEKEVITSNAGHQVERSFVVTSFKTAAKQFI